MSEGFPPALAQKLDAARNAVMPVPKNGDADEGYKFHRHSDIGEEARRALSANGILVLPSLEAIEPKYGKSGTLVHARLSFEVIDIDSGESATKSWYGAGFDSPGDKAIYQAITGGTKYFRLYLLEIPIGMDPEAGIRAAEAEAADADRIRGEQDARAEVAHV